MATYSPSNHSDRNSHFVAQHIGMTVKVITREERVMSDVYADVTYAVCYIPSKDAFESVYVRAHFECDQSGSYADVDATEEVEARYAAYLAEIEAARVADEKARFEALRMAEAKRPAKGRTLRVVRGRKVPVGTTGVCFFVGQGRYTGRVGMNVQGRPEPVWVDERNVEAVV
jgi:hypothetical protein